MTAPRSHGRRLGAIRRAALGLVIAALWLAPANVLAAGSQPPDDPVPLLAYYYIWFDPGSWERAKSDLPLLGPYSSSDPDVMRQHIRWAQAVGIDGFIVSWKATEQLNERLETLVGLAREEDFRLAIIYQGLDFERRPQPVEAILEDLQFFSERFGDDAVFDLLGRPLVIWSGTWEFSREEIARVALERGNAFYLLASERQVDDYQQIADLLDGNAYYWSSVDPERTTGYQAKLTSMGASVHTHGGYWIAPAAPGFDARLIGGARVVERRDGETLRLEMDAALRSSPDAIGLISWNEFSENSHVEPSRNYGGRSLEVLADIRQGAVPAIPDFDSSEPAETTPPLEPIRLAPIAFLAALMAGSLLLLGARMRRGKAATVSDPEP